VQSFEKLRQVSSSNLIMILRLLLKLVKLNSDLHFLGGSG